MLRLMSERRRFLFGCLVDRIDLLIDWSIVDKSIAEQCFNVLIKCDGQTDIQEREREREREREAIGFIYI